MSRTDHPADRSSDGSQSIAPFPGEPGIPNVAEKPRTPITLSSADCFDNFQHLCRVRQFPEQQNANDQAVNGESFDDSAAPIIKVVRSSPDDSGCLAVPSSADEVALPRPAPPPSAANPIAKPIANPISPKYHITMSSFV